MPSTTSLLAPALWLAVGVLAGLLFSWLIFRYRLATLVASRIATLEERLSSRDRSLAEAENRSLALSARGQEERREMQAEIRDLAARAAQLEEALRFERKASAEKVALLAEARRELSDAFQALSSEALRQNNESFLLLARKSFERLQSEANSDLEKRERSVAELVDPVQQALQRVDQKIGELERQRAAADEGLRESLRIHAESQASLRRETARLVTALRSPAVRGRWGEVQLRRVVEMAGMVSHCDFFEQQSAQTDAGLLRPDMRVQLPGGRSIVVDAKTPLAAFIEAIELEDEESRQTKMREHARLVRQRMNELARKDYWEAFGAGVELAILFLPAESIYSAALEADPSLLEEGASRRVLLATPTTLIGILRAVAFGWRQEALATNARQISELGKELYARLSSLGEHFADLGSGLKRAIGAYNRAVGALESRVLVSARRFRDLKAAEASSQIGALDTIPDLPRDLQAPEICGENPEDLDTRKRDRPEEPPAS